MNRLLQVLIAIGFLATASCGTLTSGASLGSNAPSAMIAAEKTLTIAHLAYNGIGEALKAAATSGALRGANAATAKVWYDKAGDALNAADAADRLANAQGVLAQVAAAEDAIAQADAVIHPKK